MRQNVNVRKVGGDLYVRVQTRVRADQVEEFCEHLEQMMTTMAKQVDTSAAPESPGLSAQVVHGGQRATQSAEQALNEALMKKNTQVMDLTTKLEQQAADHARALAEQKAERAREQDETARKLAEFERRLAALPSPGASAPTGPGAPLV